MFSLPGGVLAPLPAPLPPLTLSSSSWSIFANKTHSMVLYRFSILSPVCPHNPLLSLLLPSLPLHPAPGLLLATTLCLALLRNPRPCCTPALVTEQRGQCHPPKCPRGNSPLSSGDMLKDPSVCHSMFAISNVRAVSASLSFRTLERSLPLLALPLSWPHQSTFSIKVQIQAASPGKGSSMASRALDRPISPAPVLVARKGKGVPVL